MSINKKSIIREFKSIFYKELKQFVKGIYTKKSILGEGHFAEKFEQCL